MIILKKKEDEIKINQIKEQVENDFRIKKETGVNINISKNITKYKYEIENFKIENLKKEILVLKQKKIRTSWNFVIKVLTLGFVDRNQKIENKIYMVKEEINSLRFNITNISAAKEIKSIQPVLIDSSSLVEPSAPIYHCSSL